MPGPWRGAIVPHMRHWQDLVSARRLGRKFMGHRDQYAHLTEQIWLVAGTQSTKTRSLLYASLGYLVDQWPSPKALVLPRLKDFKKVLDNRVRPFFNETPTLARHFPQRASLLKQAITYSAWTLDTCTLYMLCGELADDLRSFPISDLFFDEFDLLPIDCEGQGDPIELVLDRQKTWPRTKLAIGVTTPTAVDGHGWRRLCSGSHERLFVRCRSCGADQELHPDQLRWPADKTPDQIKVHRLASWACAYCKAEVADDGTKDRLVAEAADAFRYVPGTWAITGETPGGKWTPHADFDDRHQITRVHAAETTIRTGCVNSLYSQFVSLSEFAAHELAAKQKGNASEWTAHLNGWRCEPTIQQVAPAIDMTTLGEKATGSHYGLGTCPTSDGGKLALICDQQGNSRATAWFPYVVRYIAPGGDSWLVDAGKAMSFEELETLEKREYTIGSDRVAPDVVAMDGANGMMRVPIQTWAAKDPSHRIVLQGRFWPDFLWRERIAGSKKETLNKRIISGARVYSYHSNAYRTEVDSRMRWQEGSRKWNLPDDSPDFYLASLTAEEQVLDEIRLPGVGRTKQLVWKPRITHDQQGKIVVRTDNHWWDCEVMAAVVADILGWNETRPKGPKPKYGFIGMVEGGT